MFTLNLTCLKTALTEFRVYLALQTTRCVYYTSVRIGKIKIFINNKKKICSESVAVWCPFLQGTHVRVLLHILKPSLSWALSVPLNLTEVFFSLWVTNVSFTCLGSRVGVVVRVLASHQCDPGLIPGPGIIIMWVEFVVGSLLCYERFFSGYSGFPLSSETNISKFQFDPGMHGHFKRVLVNSWCSVIKQITFLHLDLHANGTVTEFLSRGISTPWGQECIHFWFLFLSILQPLLHLVYFCLHPMYVGLNFLQDFLVR